MAKLLISKKQVKAYVLATAKEHRPRFTRVSSSLYPMVDAHLRIWLREYIHRLPSVGKTMVGIVLAVLLSTAAYAADGLDIVKKTVAMESASQDEFGQYLVASVIVNRAMDAIDKKPDAVISHSLKDEMSRQCLRAKQFSCWNDRKWSSAWLSKNYTIDVERRSGAAVNYAMEFPYAGIDHYHARHIYPFWARGKKPVIAHGDHLFYDLT